MIKLLRNTCLFYLSGSSHLVQCHIHLSISLISLVSFIAHCHHCNVNSLSLPEIWCLHFLASSHLFIFLKYLLWYYCYCPKYHYEHVSWIKTTSLSAIRTKFDHSLTFWCLFLWLTYTISEMNLCFSQNMHWWLCSCIHPFHDHLTHSSSCSYFLMFPTTISTSWASIILYNSKK
jgi:hypothetical protein